MRTDADFDLYLASASPRRRELLQQIGIRFHLIPDLEVEEHRRLDESPVDFVSRIAHDKAEAGLARVSQQGMQLKPVLGADTCIEIDGDILGKPADRDDGYTMLRRLSGRSHNVLSGICIIDGASGRNHVYSDVSRSKVTFKRLSDQEIRHYWETGEPADKAGSYAIQGVAAKFISDLQGSFSGVVGLPLFELNRLLESIN